MIETERLILRPFVKEDAEAVLEYLAEPEVHCFSDMKLNTLEDARREVTRRALEDTEYYFAICLKESGKVIGEIFSSPENMGTDEGVLDTFSPCWMLNPAQQGNGYEYAILKKEWQRPKLKELTTNNIEL